jgi:hypothetical protein
LISFAQGNNKEIDFTLRNKFSRLVGPALLTILGKEKELIDIYCQFFFGSAFLIVLSDNTVKFLLKSIFIALLFNQSFSIIYFSIL